MSLHLSGAAARLRRSLPLAAATALALALPAGASAADNLGAGGVVIPGSALKVGVSGAANQAGKVSARFSAVDSPLFWGSDTTNMNDTSAAVFALNTPSGLYSAQSEVPVDNAPFTQTSAPVLTGTGTAGDPYVVTSHFDATASIHVTQTITHVSGTTQFKATWSILNNGGPTNMQAFEAADMYVNGNDNGTGTASGSSPNRVIGSVASDGTQGQLIEQAASPWNHYFSGMNSPYYDATGDSTYGYLPDTIDPTVQDSGEGVEWDITVPSNGTRTLSVVWNFTHPALPQAPQITGGVPAANATTTATTASPAFTYATGDASHVVAYQCAIDGGGFSACTTPKALSGLADGAHTFSVRAINSAGDPGPQTDRTWTVDTTPPGAPGVTGAPTGTVATDAATLTLTGEAGAMHKCSVDGGAFVTCTSPLNLTGLADGNHTVSVKQVDAANNAGTLVTTKSWTVLTAVPAAPSTDAEPEPATTQTDARVEFTTPAGLTPECSLDGGAYQACASPVDVNGLSIGTHTMQLRMVNAAGTAGAPRSITWEVKASPVATPPTTNSTNNTTIATTTTKTETPAKTSETPAQTTIVPPSCVSRRSVNVHWALPAGAKAKAFKILVDGKVVKTVSAKARSYRVSLAGRPAATVKVQVKAVGAKLATTRTYKTCSAKAGNDELATVLLKKA
ncbi:hypothetical protein [Baekduia sp. Peel2402]|uniref:hypothetical protein n=1 Tax=Baekduia sp. Peel2402 TaxID=3458296 RepID=UPI00403E39EE